MFEDRYTDKEIALLAKGAPTKGTIEVRMKDPKRSGSVTLRDFFQENPDGSREHRPFIDAKGSSRVQKYTRKRTLNMTVLNDRLEYAHLKEHPLYVKGSSPVLVLYNFDEEATDYVAAKDAAAEADGIIRKLKTEGLQDLARVLQIKTRPASSDIVLKRALYEYAENQQGSANTLGALTVLEQIQSPDYDTKVMLYKALETKEVEVRNGRYLFGQIGLGTTFDVALQFLNDNPDMESELAKKLNLKIVK
tara:strand:+ start:2649 stop:3395 length:747 start_codon:yes stop_codon:yes gene_type:complete